MTIEKSDKVNLPTWLVVLLLPMLISLITTLGVYSFSSGKQSKQVEINTKILETKVNVGEFEMIKKQLDRIEINQNRIENKLDNHIIK